MAAVNANDWSGPLQVRRYAGEYPAHQHDFSQVLIGLSGSLELEVDGHSAFVDASCGLVVPPNARHAYLVNGAARVLVVDCSPRQGADRLRRFASPQRWRRGGESLTASDVLAELDVAPTLLPRRRIDIEAVTRLIDAQLHRDWTVADLAALCHLSPQRFRARFAELTGTSPLGYVRSLRLDQAHQLIRAGMTLEAAALQVGYASGSALSFAMRRDRGEGARDARRPGGPVRAFLES